MSESQLGGSLLENSQCDVLSAEKLVEDNGRSANTVQAVFSSTPFIIKKRQPDSQQRKYYSTHSIQ